MLLTMPLLFETAGAMENPKKRELKVLNKLRTPQETDEGAMENPKKRELKVIKVFVNLHDFRTQFKRGCNGKSQETGIESYSLRTTSVTIVNRCNGKSQETGIERSKFALTCSTHLLCGCNGKSQETGIESSSTCGVLRCFKMQVQWKIPRNGN